jgi:hypothetical protein
MEAVSYRADDDARALRADALITEIADLERKRLAQAAAEARLAAARQELADLQGPPPTVAAPRERPPGVIAHALAFTAAAALAFAGYTLLL